MFCLELELEYADGQKIKKWPKCIILIGGWQPPISDRSQGFLKNINI